MRTADAARGKWKQILIQLGIDAKFLTKKNVPCPFCEGTNRFSFTDADDDGLYYCRRCGGGNGFKLAMLATGKDFKETANIIDSMVGNIEIAKQPKSSVDPSIRLKKIASALVPIGANDPVTRYLSSRGCGIPLQRVKLHPGLTYYENGVAAGTYPAMVSAVTDKDDKLLTFHITYLTDDGGKAPVENPKKVLKALGRLQGAAIRLFPYNPLELAITEGIETALRVAVKRSIPVWCVLNTSIMESFIPPKVKRLTIYGDNDKKHSGQKSAYLLANKLALKGLDVIVKIPNETGLDWGDKEAWD